MQRPLSTCFRARGKRETTTALILLVTLLLFAPPIAPRGANDPPIATASVRVTVSGTAGGWQQFRTPTGFPGLYYPSLASDPSDLGVIQFGGCTSVLCTSASNATWLYSEGSWSRLAPSVAPTPRGEAQMTWDPADGSVVLFGGHGCQNPPVCDHWGSLNDTWTFSGGAWHRVLTGVAPPPTIEGALAYDPSGQQVVLFGGYGCFVRCTTWTYSSGSWTALNLTTSPSFRYDAGFAEDDHDNGALLFGGVASGVLDDTWLFSHGGWHGVASSAHPGLRQSPVMGFDPGLGLVVLFGGLYITLANFPGITYRDTWTFQSGAWVEALIGTATPGARFEAAGATDPSSGVFVMSGGCGPSGCPYTDTWGFGVFSAVGFNSSRAACANFTLDGVPQASGSSVLFENASYALNVTACPGYRLTNVTTVGNLTLTLGHLNDTRANGSVLVGGPGTVVANVSAVGTSPAPALFGGRLPLSVFQFELVILGAVVASAAAGTFLIFRRRRPPHPVTRPASPSPASVAARAPQSPPKTA
ncbi:MAG: hypothetical protein L3K15_05955 [Thermoplasmata archaeon]|nr:hypothetical protein [Thermoplasmata archaeon]